MGWIIAIILAPFVFYALLYLLVGILALLLSPIWILEQLRDGCIAAMEWWRNRCCVQKMKTPR